MLEKKWAALMVIFLTYFIYIIGQPTVNKRLVEGSGCGWGETVALRGGEHRVKILDSEFSKRGLTFWLLYISYMKLHIWVSFEPQFPHGNLLNSKMLLFFFFLETIKYIWKVCTYFLCTYIFSTDSRTPRDIIKVTLLSLFPFLNDLSQVLK